MSKKLFTAILTATYLFGLVLAGPLNIANLLAKTPVSGPVSSPKSGPVSLYITGHIRLVTSPISGVRVYLLSRTKTSSRVVAQTQSDSNGIYRFATLSQGGYIVRPQDPRFTFSPVDQVVNLVRNSLENIDFTAVLN